MNDNDEGFQKAILALLRLILESNINSAAVIFSIDHVPPASAYKAALEGLARRCSGGTLISIPVESVLEAQRSYPFTIHALCSVAGLTYSELRDRAPLTPGNPDGDWTLASMQSAFNIIDRIIHGLDSTDLPGAKPARSLDLISNVSGATLQGREATDHATCNGVPYEVLLAQRSPDGSWLANRNSTSDLLNRAAADSVSYQLDHVGLRYSHSTAVGGDIQPSVIRTIAGSDEQIGIVVIDRFSEARYAITFATTRDLGTVRTSAAPFRTMTRDPNLPIALVLAGGGWAERNETESPVREFTGRVFSEKGIGALVADIK